MPEKNILGDFLAPITTAFTQQFKEMFGTLNEFIAASIPSVQYFKSVTESFKIQETLARSSLDYSKALDFLTGQLDRVEGSRVENMKEVVANFEAGIRTTGDDLLTLQSELRRTGVDTQLSRKVFSELYGITGGNVQSQNMLAKVVRETSKSQLVSMDTLVKALDSVSDEMRTTSIIAGDPTRVDRITTAMAGMAASLPEGMRSELLKFIMSTENYSNRLMTGTEDIVQAIKTETDVAKLPALLEQLYSQLGSSLDSLTSGSDEFTKTLILERLGLGALYASQSTVQKLVEQQKLTGKASSDQFAKFAADTDAVSKTMKSTLEMERRKKGEGGMDELTGMKDAINLTTGSLNGLKVVTDTISPVFEELAKLLKNNLIGGPKPGAANLPNAGLPLVAMNPQAVQAYRDAIQELNQGKDKLKLLHQEYAQGTIGINEFNKGVQRLLKDLNNLAGSTTMTKLAGVIERQLETYDENLGRSSASLTKFIDDLKTNSNFQFYREKNMGTEDFFGELSKRNIQLNKEQKDQFEKDFLSLRKQSKDIEESYAWADAQQRIVELNNKATKEIIGKLNALNALNLAAKENIDEGTERKARARQYSEDLNSKLFNFIEITTEAQRTQKLNNKNIEDIARVLKSHATLLEGIVKVPGIGDNLMIGVGASLLSQREPQ